MSCWFVFKKVYCMDILFPFSIVMIVFPKLLLLWTGFFMLTIWLPALFSPKVFIRIMETTLKNSDIIRVRAFIVMIMGFLYLSVYRKFNNGRMMFFSLFGWLSLLKWLLLLRFPNWGYSKYKWFYATTTGSIVMWIAVILFSIFTIRLGYYWI